jgi:hypothetical protein
MIEIGTLVQDCPNGDLGIVTGYWADPVYGIEHVLVRYLTGYWEGQTDPTLPSSLEVLS